MLYPLLSFYEKFPDSQDRMTQAITARERAEQAFNKAKQQKDNLPRLALLLESTEFELKEASKKLPNEFKMDEILQKTSTLANNVGLFLEDFTPGKGEISGDTFKYLTMPVKIQLTGAFDQVVRFYDQIVHLDLLVHIKNIKFTPVNDKQEKEVILYDSTLGAKASEKIASKTKQASYLVPKLVATADMIIFRSLTDAEVLELTKKVELKTEQKPTKPNSKEMKSEQQSQAKQPAQ